MRPGTFLPFCLFVCLGGCGAGSESGEAAGVAARVDTALLPPPYALTVRALDEAGGPAAGVAELDGVLQTLDADGRATFGGLVGPVTIVVRAAGHLEEPVVLGPEDALVERIVRPRARLGPGGAPRLAIHVGGPVMLGRRFIAPTEPDTCVATPGDGGASARAAVASLAPLFGAADLRLVQVETVIGDRPESEAYPGKSVLFQSIPELLDALLLLKADVAGLAHDHARDWLEAGLAGTLDALRGAGLTPVGAGLNEAEAAAPAVRDVGGLRVGVVAYSSIWGDYANDAYPDEGIPAPPGLDPALAFQYVSRTWGFGAIPVQARRIKTAWLALRAEEPGMSGVERAALWASASSVYPELQDWVARRGHGGANSTSSARMASEIQALKTAGGCDLVIVLLHAGHELAEAPAEAAARHAREAVDAGADAVIHHARVAQGFEIYKGKLICLGLGNALSDQDLLDTFLSGVLRLVYERDTLLEARYLPITLHRYRPAPLTGRMAARAISKLRERSAIEALMGLYGGEARAALSPRPAASVAPAFRPDGNAARIVPWDGSVEILDVPAAAAPLELPAGGLVRSRGPGGTALPGVLFGRDLFRWGAFEDDLADGLPAGGPQWSLYGASANAGVPVTFGAPSGLRAMHLTRGSSNSSRVRLRPVASVPLPAHRVWIPVSPDLALPGDGPATYSLSFQARKSGTGATRFTLDAYGGSRFVRSVELGFDVPADDAWHAVWLDLSAAIFAEAVGVEPDRVLLYVGLHPPADGVSELRMDDLRFVEWRAPDAQPDGFTEAVVVRSAGTTLERRPE